MRTSVQMLAPTQAAAQQGRGTRVVILDQEAHGPPNRTQVQIQGIEESAPATLPGGGSDPLKTRVRIVSRIEGAAPVPVGPADTREAMLKAIEAEKKGLDQLDKLARQAGDRLEQLQASLQDFDERRDEQEAVLRAAQDAAAGAALKAAEEAAAQDSGAPGGAGEQERPIIERPIIETTGEQIPNRPRHRGFPGEDEE